ncbi:MAG: alanine--tRNA ligase [Armatimonadetes bacterium]|nr:alanine--tRNA ligase [Armatimonadota bacterium]
MTGREIRENFLQFFEQRGHRRLPSASLIPRNDPSILWTAAGMVPFKPYFTGAARPDFLRVTTCQKCLRTPDIESVGLTSRHHTFFEMLGNFSFGDYFKEEAIPWAWEFVTGVLKIDPQKLWVSIYLDDDEAFEIWRRKAGVAQSRIVRMGKDTNFWEIGVGPCGPCSEIYVDLGEERGCGLDTCGVGCDCDRFLEIWNLVFIQFFRDEAGNYTPLKQKGIDTGMGLERVASVLQNVPTNFDTDLFREIMDYTAGLAGVRYGVDQGTDRALKVIADHGRAVTFAVADGALPSNEGRGYVLRRILRRAVRFGRKLGITEPFLHRVAEAIVRQMSGAYPELAANAEHVYRVVRTEETRFLETVAQGMEILENIFARAGEAGRAVIEGADAFRLYDTYGFPLELTKEIAAERGFTVDEAGFAAAMAEQRERARKSRQEIEYLSEDAAFYQTIREQFGETKFVGYTDLEAKGRILFLSKGGRRVKEAAAGEKVEFICDVTPCYAESGGQVADRAHGQTREAEVTVENVVKPVEGIYLHSGKVESGALRENDEVLLRVDAGRRRATARNHSATHLLHKALKEVLGEHVNQAGSLVEPGRLRFDFTHLGAVSPEELRRVEQLVNDVVLANLPVETFYTSLEEARQMGAAALFEEKYAQTVRVVKMGDFSLELCGGTHVRSTGEIGLFKLTGESSIGTGLRRVEAVTGQGALAFVNALEDQLTEISSLFKTSPAELIPRAEGLLGEIKELERENESLRARLNRYEVQFLLNQVRDLNGIKFLAARTEASDMDGLRAMVDLLREQIRSGVIVLGSRVNDRVNLVAAVTRDLLPQGLHAGKLIKEVAAVVGGGGGGRPEMAQAGGKNPARLQEALDKAYAVAEKQLHQ